MAVKVASRNYAPTHFWYMTLRIRACTLLSMVMLAIVAGPAASAPGYAWYPTDAPIAIYNPLTKSSSLECVDMENISAKNVRHVELLFTHVSPDYRDLGDERLSLGVDMKPHERLRGNCRNFYETTYHRGRPATSLYRGHPFKLLARLWEVRFSDGTVWYSSRDSGLWGEPVWNIPSTVPNLSPENVALLIRANLAENEPQYLVLFRIKYQNPYPGDADLARAGILKTVEGYLSCYAGPAYDLTDRGHVEAANRGWQVDNSEMWIPLGRFELVSGSDVVGKKDGIPISVTFKYVFTGNENAAYLLTLGPGKDWIVTGYNNPSRTLNDVGRSITKKLEFSLSRGKWVAREGDQWNLGSCTP
jgi:hypothetical protein